jgi:hypothetical protein
MWKFNNRYSLKGLANVLAVATFVTTTTTTPFGV